MRARLENLSAILLGIGITYIVYGYQFGTSNHTVYLLSALRDTNPQLLANDWFTTQTLQYHAAFGWLTFVLNRLHVLQPAFWIGYLALIALLHIAWFGIVRMFNGSTRAYLLSVLFFHLSAGGTGLGMYQFFQDSSFLPSNIAAVALLCGIYFRMRASWISAAICFALAGLFHLNYAIVAVVLWIALTTWDVIPAKTQALSRTTDRRRPPLRLRDIPPIYLLATALVLIPCVANTLVVARIKLTSGPGMPLHDFIDLYVRLRHPHHYELQSWPLALWLSVLWPMPIAFVWLKRERRQNDSRALVELARISFVLAALILIAIIGAGIWYLSESLVQMSLYRFTIYLQLFACIATALLIEQTKREIFTLSALALLSAVLLVVVTFISKSPIIASRQVAIIILAVAFAFLASWRVLPRAINLILACLLLVTAIGAPKASGVIRWVQQDDPDYLQLCDWARTHTPIDAIFLTPPNETEMRLRGQRAIIVNYKCVPQLSSGLKQWRDRLQDVLDLPSLLVLPRGMLNTENAIAQRYSSLAGEHLVKVAKQYGARYVVATHRLGNLPDLAMVYRSSTGRYLVYDLAREQRKEAQVSPEEIQRAMLDRFAIRVQPAMSQYILDHLNKKTQTEIPIMGSHARTGVPVRQHIPLGALQQQTPAVSPGA